jgi:hypothetical protein
MLLYLSVRTNGYSYNIRMQYMLTQIYVMHGIHNLYVTRTLRKHMPYAYMKVFTIRCSIGEYYVTNGMRARGTVSQYTDCSL